jgi:hypothetical protein
MCATDGSMTSFTINRHFDLNNFIMSFGGWLRVVLDCLPNDSPLSLYDMRCSSTSSSSSPSCSSSSTSSRTSTSSTQAFSAFDLRIVHHHHHNHHHPKHHGNGSSGYYAVRVPELNLKGSTLATTSTKTTSMTIVQQ